MANGRITKREERGSRAGREQQASSSFLDTRRQPGSGPGFQGVLEWNLVLFLNDVRHTEQCHHLVVKPKIT